MQYLLYFVIMAVISCCFCMLTKKKIQLSVRTCALPELSQTKYGYRSRNKPTIVFVGLILGIVVLFYFALRFVGKVDGVILGGIDSIVYKDRFLESTGNIFAALKGQSNEMGYGLLVYVVRIFTSNFNVFLLVYYTLLMVLACNFVKEFKGSSLVYIGIVIYIVIPLFISINLMRNVLAYFLVCNASIYLVKKKYLKFIVFSLLAVSCHVSAILIFAVGIIYWVINSKKVNFPVIIGLTCLVILLGFAVIEILTKLLSETKYANYFSEGAFAKSALAINVLLCFFIWIRQATFLQSKEAILGLAFLIVNIIIMVLQTELAILYRFFMFAGAGFLFLFENCEKVFNNRRNATEYTMIVLGLIVYFIFVLVGHVDETIQSYGLLPWHFMTFGG